MGSLSSLIVFIENALYPFRVLKAYSSRFLNRIGGKRFGKLTMAGKIGIAFFLGFVIFITINWVMGIFNPKVTRLHEITKYHWIDYPIYYLIALLISIVLYWGIRLATREKPTLYPEIDDCWTPIEEWREKQSLEWHDFKRFLVLGPNLEVSKAMHAEMKGRSLGALPSGSSDWMHWFGTQDSVYLHLKKICHTSQRLETLGTGRGNGFGGAGGSGHFFDPTNTLQASVGADQWSVDAGMDLATAEIDGSFGASMDGDFGTSLDPAQSLDPYDSENLDVADPVQSEEGNAEAGGEEVELGEDGDTPLERVQYLSQLVLQKSKGEMPFHGVVVVIPFDKFMAGENHKPIATAIKKDLLELRRQTDVIFPVSFVFSSMETDQGFPKLQNLLGSQRVSTGRFGAGCRAEAVPTIAKNNLAIQVQRACQSFEDWVVNRWGKSTQLARAAQNKELYKMLIRIRQKFQPRLSYLVENTLVWKASESPNEAGSDLTLSGCYFVSTGQHSSDRGFLNGVFLKCDEFAATTSWGNKILNRDRFYSALSTLLFTMSLLIVIGSGVYLYYSQ